MSDKFALIPNRKEIAILKRIYADAEKSILNELLKVNFLGYKESTAAQIEEKVKIIVNRLNRLAIRWTNKTIPTAYEESYLKSVEILNKIGAEKDPFFDNSKNKLSVMDSINLTSADLIKSNQSINRNIATFLTLAKQANIGIQQIQAFDLADEEIISGLLDDAIREGQSRGELNQLIRKHFNRELYEKKFININGRNYNLIKYAETVSSTRIRKLQSEAVKNSCEQYENDLIEISDHGTMTEICLPFEGNIYSISGKSQTYPLLTEWPPYHPRCQHSAAPTSEIVLRATERFG